MPGSWADKVKLFPLKKTHANLHVIDNYVSSKSDTNINKKSSRCNIPKNVLNEKELEINDDIVIYNKYTFNLQSIERKKMEKLTEISKSFNKINNYIALKCLQENRKDCKSQTHENSRIDMTETQLFAYIDTLLCHIKDKDFLSLDDFSSKIDVIFKVIKSTQNEKIKIKCLKLLGNTNLLNNKNSNGLIQSFLPHLLSILFKRYSDEVSFYVLFIIYNLLQETYEGYRQLVVKLSLDFKVFNAMTYLYNNKIRLKLSKSSDLFLTDNRYYLFRIIMKLCRHLSINSDDPIYKNMKHELNKIHDIYKELFDSDKIEKQKVVQLSKKILRYTKLMKHNKLKVSHAFIFNEFDEMVNYLTTSIWNKRERKWDNQVHDLIQKIWEVIYKILNYVKNSDEFNELMVRRMLATLDTRRIDDYLGVFNMSVHNMLNLINENNLAIFIDCNIMNKLFSIIDHYHYGMLPQDEEFILKAICLMNNRQLKQFKGLEIAVKFIWMCVFRLCDDDKKYDKQSVYDMFKIISIIIGTKNEQMIAKMFILLKKIRFFENCYGKLFKQDDVLYMKVDNLCNIYKESMINHHFASTKSRNYTLTNRYIAENISIGKYDYFSNELMVIISQYLGYCNNNLHLFKHSVIGYLNTKYVITDINYKNDVILIKNKNNNQIQQIKSGKVEQVLINEFNAKNKFVKILCGAYKNYMGKIIDIWNGFGIIKLIYYTNNERWDGNAWNNPLSNHESESHDIELVLLEFLTPLKFNRFPLKKDEITFEIDFHPHNNESNIRFGVSLIPQKIHNLTDLKINNIDSNENDGIISSLSTYVAFTNLNRTVRTEMLCEPEVVWEDFMTEDKIKFDKMKWMFCEIYPYSSFDIDGYNQFCKVKAEPTKYSDYKYGVIINNQPVNNCLYLYFIQPFAKTFGRHEIKTIEERFGIKISEKLSVLILHKK